MPSGLLEGPIFTSEHLVGLPVLHAPSSQKDCVHLWVPVVSWGEGESGHLERCVMSSVPFRPTRSHAVGLYWALIGFFHPFLDCFLPLQHMFPHQLPSFYLHPDLPPCNTQASIIPEDIIASNAFFLSLLNYKLYGDRGCESAVLNFH